MSSPGTPTDVFKTADAVLTAVAESALALGVNLPGERYVTTGQAVHDCEQVAVVALAARTGLPPSGNVANQLPGSASGTGWYEPPWSLTVSVEIVRTCQPVPTRSGGVSKKAMSAAALVSSDDAQVLMGVPERLTAHTYANIDIAVQLPPVLGGFVATTATVTLVMA